MLFLPGFSLFILWLCVFFVVDSIVCFKLIVEFVDCFRLTDNYCLLSKWLVIV